MLDLAIVHSIDHLTAPVAAANVLDNPSARAIASTALMIGELQSFIDDKSPRSSFDSDNLILFPPVSPSPPTDTTRHYLRELVREAQFDAANISCSSILAGTGSESDDTGDIALWLGNGDFATPDQVLAALGLTEWAAGGEVVMSNFTVPSGLDGLLRELDDQLCFRATAPMLTGGIVLFFLVGRVSGGCAGLVGIGTWS